MPYDRNALDALLLRWIAPLYEHSPRWIFWKQDGHILCVPAVKHLLGNNLSRTEQSCESSTG